MCLSWFYVATNNISFCFFLAENRRENNGEEIKYKSELSYQFGHASFGFENECLICFGVLNLVSGQGQVPRFGFLHERCLHHFVSSVNLVFP